MRVDELLPIGSVIWLKEAERPLMIFGVKQANMETGEEYDYIGVVYPEGNMGTQTQFLFQHKDIERVVFRGYEDEAREHFIQNLTEFYEGKINALKREGRCKWQMRKNFRDGEKHRAKKNTISQIFCSMR